MPAVARGARRTTNAREPRETQDGSSNGPEQRKLRNRMSQRAFRARQAMRIQELEERLEQTTAPDMVWATQLQDQNMKLRQQLLEVHKKAINIQISLKALADAASKALGIDSVGLDELSTLRALDQVLSDVGQAYVVQADLSTLVKCPQPVIGYVPVWALVQAITAGDSRADFPSNPMHMSCSTAAMPAMEDFDFASAHGGGSQHSTSLPANNATELFSNATLAREAHLLLGIGDGAAFNYRLDPSFFELYPELYDSQSNVMAHGVRLRANSRFEDAPYPVFGALSASTITQYRELSKIALDCVAV
ncbi:Putative basic-leucine zipper domain-containing protein [Septoria linicola]|uniref:Basic-leucine zipper domain-containing protein n=1 Tax=Septoria linicola TaxID=215465 RepID=A0A9Q9APH8_9PEZI|nr:Putative basic-leucine zipper domain-containing protein [Septoria linicola]